MKVLIAMSGGIDSTVAAMLLQEKGMELTGATFRISDSTTAAEEGAEMARRLGIPHQVLDLREPFEQLVIGNFTGEYLQGRTPNPCVVCNYHIKWGKLLELADSLGCSHIATGHYARIREKEGRWFLRQGADTAKDQTYFLWRLEQEALARTLFPLGDLTKGEVRGIAHNRGYEQLSQKKESQEICFIPDNDYRKFLTDRMPGFSERYQPGWFVDPQGKRLGEHRGYPFYTVGQRKGLGIALGYPAFVLAIDPARNEVILGTREELNGTGLVATHPNWMKYARVEPGFPVLARIRYRDKGVPALLYPEADRVRVVFSEPTGAISPGQSVVFYEDDTVVGGAIIDA